MRLANLLLWNVPNYIQRLKERLEDPNLDFEIRAELQTWVGILADWSAPAPRPPSPVDLEAPKLPPLDSGDVEPTIRISIGPTPEMEYYLSLGYKPVAVLPPRPPSPELKAPKLPPLDSGDMEPSCRISVGPSPQLEHYLSLGWKMVAPKPPKV